MAVDSLSYLGNMLAECQTSSITRARLELAMSAVSLLLLAYFTGYFFIEAAHNAGLLPEEGAREEDVNPYIVLAFAALGVLFDVLSLLAYKVWHMDPAATSSGGAKTNSVNMLTALLHVMSDFVRSTTTFVEGLVLLSYPSINGAVIDGWSALIVCTVISFGVLGGCVSWVRELFVYLSSSNGTLRAQGSVLV